MHYSGYSLIFYRDFMVIPLISHVQIIHFFVHEDKICPFPYLESF